jgi:hypothetical protein
MKTPLASIAVVVLLTTASAQEREVVVGPNTTPVAQKTRTDLEAFEAAKGKLIIRGQVEVGGLTNSTSKIASKIVRIAAREAVTLNNDKRFGMVVMLNPWGAPSAEVDYMEIGGLLKALETMLKPDTNYTKLAPLDWTYRTTSKLALKTWQEKEGVKLMVTIGDTNASDWVVVDQPEEFRKLVQECKAKIESVR